MVAYSFKPRFVDPILSGRKRQTVRADRNRHARPGEQLQLYTGMRTKACRLIARSLCQDCPPIRLEPSLAAALKLSRLYGISLDDMAAAGVKK